ncbi:MAG: hypothetical protein V4508_03885 [Pseudomonadota bacterium]
MRVEQVQPCLRRTERKDLADLPTALGIGAHDQLFAAADSPGVQVGTVTQLFDGENSDPGSTPRVHLERRADVRQLKHACLARLKRLPHAPGGKPTRSRTRRANELGSAMEHQVLMLVFRAKTLRHAHRLQLEGRMRAAADQPLVLEFVTLDQVDERLYPRPAFP